MYHCYTYVSQQPISLTIKVYGPPYSAGTITITNDVTIITVTTSSKSRSQVDFTSTSERHLTTLSTIKLEEQVVIHSTLDKGPMRVETGRVRKGTYFNM